MPHERLSIEFNLEVRRGGNETWRREVASYAYLNEDKVKIKYSLEEELESF